MTQLRMMKPLRAAVSALAITALDAALMKDGRDVGNVVVQRREKDGSLRDAIHDVSFAFAFRAFFPKGMIHHE